MFLVFLDSQLKYVWEDSSHKSKRWSPGLVKAIRKKIQLLANAYDERNLKNVRSLHFKKLKGDRAGTYSIRVNEQYRCTGNCRRCHPTWSDYEIGRASCRERV